MNLQLDSSHIVRGLIKSGSGLLVISGLLWLLFS